MSLILSTKEPFARGGNRLCFVDPQHPDRCIKVRRPDKPLEERRAKKGFPKRLMPLSYFDDNAEEFRVMQDFQQRYPEALFQHVSRCFGWVQTDLGPGLSSELVRDSGGGVSMSLKLYLWHFGYTVQCREAVSELQAHWIRFAVPSRELLVHNIVVQMQSSDITRLVVIDGLGNSGLSALPFLPLFLRRHFAARKANGLDSRIEQFLDSAKDGVYRGLQGVPMRDGKPDVPPPKSGASSAVGGHSE